MKYQLITKYRGQIMGFAAIMIVLLHFFVELYDNLRFPVISTLLKRGNIGVDIFLFVSGMGLFFSMSKNADIVGFYQKRIKRVIIPALLISLPYWILTAIFVNHDSIGMFFLNWSGISLWTHGVTTTWYVSLITVLYLLYPLVFKLQKKSSAIVVVIAAIAWAAVFSVFACNPEVYARIEIALTRIPVFLMGSYFGEAFFSDEPKQKKIHCTVTVYMILALLLMLIGIYYQSKNHELSVMLYRLGSGGAAILICLVVSRVLDLLQPKRISKVLTSLGAISLELYLIHVFIRNGLVYSHIGEGSGMIMQFLIIILAITVSLILSYCVSKLEKRFLFSDPKK